PLPRYSDGTEALESECQWIASPNEFRWPGSGKGPELWRCTTQGRTVSVYACTYSCNPITYGKADYVIIAVHQVLATIPAVHRASARASRRGYQGRRHHLCQARGVRAGAKTPRQARYGSDGACSARPCVQSHPPPAE